MSNDEPTLEELYAEHTQTLEEFLEANGYDCDQCQNEVKDLKKITKSLRDKEIKNAQI